MATVKLATLAIRTIAKPISARLKHEAQQHPFFRRICVQLAQRMYRYEMKLGTVVLGQPPRTIKPLSETKAIDNGANFIAESFLFAVAASLIVAETWRSSNKESKRREGVTDQLEELSIKMQELLNEQRARHEEVSRVLQTIVDTGLRGGWVEFQDRPLMVPRIDIPRETQELAPPPPEDPPDAPPAAKDDNDNK
ncbi:OPA3-domain-containing protein [Ramaria rubella]|nr:OPA3-domain-containing protein [Ramaria rubella]